MAIPSKQLFLDRFIEYNVLRYQDKPSLVAMFQGLTLDKVTFSNFQEATDGEGKTYHSYSVVAPGVFTGNNQRFYPADYILNNVTNFEEESPVEDIDALEHKSTPGIYLVEGLGGRVLVLNGEKTEENVRAVFKNSCKYELNDDDIELEEAFNSIAIKSETILGHVLVVESLFDNLPRFNGQYRFDGSVAAL